MDWIHCNNCFALPESEKNFLLTSCGHIYCNDCEEQCARGKCKLCGNQCITIVLSSTMKPDVQVYFMDPDELLKKKLKEVNQVSEFQKNHRVRLMAHQKKQLKKFKAVKEDFRKLLKNLKDLDNDRKRLVQENDLLKKFVTSGMQRHHAEPASISLRQEKGHNKSPFDNAASPSNVDSVLSKFIDKLDVPKSHSGIQQRVSVISPPMNGKLGIIKNTPSPSSTLRKLNLSSSHSNDSLHKKSSMQFETPHSTPGSYKSTFVTPMSGAGSPMDSSSGTSHYQQNKSVQYKRDVKKMVVHPFSPEDSPLF